MSAAATAPASHATRAEKPGWLRGLACGVLIMLNPASGLLLAVLLSPSLLMRVLDREPGRAASRVVLLANLAGSVGAVATLWRDGVPALADAITLLAAPTTVAVAWAASAGGWLGSEVMSQIALAWLDARARRELQALRARTEKLAAEWGEPPTPTTASESR